MKGDQDGNRAPNKYVSSRNIYNLSSCIAEASFTKKTSTTVLVDSELQTSARRACVGHVGITRQQFLAMSSMVLNDPVHFF